ncbi:hypothetical protein [Oscillatoria nigro-viridis]|uniref:hypothetical protein n=1 Tax=Phormidium nigroviride TaxID=482564 RepID=UPI00167F35FD|nr:hypothetical protein [Oscillatoria nigro-viridis]
MDASTRFLYEHRTSEDEGECLKNRLSPVIRASATVIRAIAPQQIAEKTTISES